MLLYENIMVIIELEYQSCCIHTGVYVFVLNSRY